MDKRKIITAIVGPKGGVGKSTISVNLAIALAKLGKKIIAVDLDLGASNLHAIFGLRTSKHSLDDFIQNRVRDLADIILETGIDNVGVIRGGDIPGITNMPYQKKMKLIRHLSTLDSDLVILDLAPGASHNVVDFSIFAQRTLLVTTAEVPSLLNVYSFIKSAVFRRLTFFFKYKKCIELIELLERAKNSDNCPRLTTIEGFLQEARKIDPDVTDSAKKILLGMKPFLIVNRIRSERDANAGVVIQNLMHKYLSIKSTVIMTIREDDTVGTAIAKMKPVIAENPDSPFSQDIGKIAERLCE